MMTFDQLFE